ncbi:MAG: lipopolysaccharide kinase InaA family protein [Burkholderiales bacterium]
MTDYVAPGWQVLLDHNGLGRFEDFWTLCNAWVEQPNQRRGGWSGVARHELQLPQGGTTAIFVKRQENHIYRSFRHPVKGVSTCAREFAHLMRLRQRGVPTAEVVFFAQRSGSDRQQAVMATVELTGFLSLDAWYGLLHGGSIADNRSRAELVRAVANVIRAIHAQNIEHNCFYPKHILVKRMADAQFDARVIDFEKGSRQPLRLLATLRDLDTLNRRAPQWSRTDRLRFLLAYYGKSHFIHRLRRVWRLIARRGRRKAERSA